MVYKVCMFEQIFIEANFWFVVKGNEWECVRIVVMCYVFYFFDYVGKMEKLQFLLEEIL